MLFKQIRPLHTCESTYAHSMMPASPLRARRHASANLTAAYACTSLHIWHYIHQKEAIISKNSRILCKCYKRNIKFLKKKAIAYFFPKKKGKSKNKMLTIDRVAEPAPALAYRKLKHCVNQVSMCSVANPQQSRNYIQHETAKRY